MTTYWFKQKRYGYGAMPTTWQGWALVLGTVALFAGAMVLFLQSGRAPGALAGLLAFEAVVIAVLCIVGYRKTEGGWRWRWGGPV
jgi:hypothetical protein